MSKGQKQLTALQQQWYYDILRQSEIERTAIQIQHKKQQTDTS